MQNSKFKINEKGLTIIELLIAMSIGLVVLGSVFSSFTTQKKAFALQEQITEMEQNLRTPIDFITRDLRNVGSNPAETLTSGSTIGLVPGEGITITTNQMRILSDLNGDGDTADDGETVTYSLSGTTLQRNGQPLVDNITAFTITYYDSNGSSITTPVTGTSLSGVRVVQVSLTARTEYEDTNYTGGINISGTAADGTCKTRTLTVRVRTRNIGLQG